MPYHLATPQNLLAVLFSSKKKDQKERLSFLSAAPRRGGRDEKIRKQGIGMLSQSPAPLSGVGNGARTHDTRNHNPVLFQLSYTHQIHNITKPRKCGTPEGIRTPGLLLRRQLLYPTELLAHMWSG